jgi:hypothetical protein
MEMMRHALHCDIQITTRVSPQTFESASPAAESSAPRPEGPLTRFTAFRDAVRANIDQNNDQKVEARRYDPATNDFAFMLRRLN